MRHRRHLLKKEGVGVCVPLEEFAEKLPYPLIIIGRGGPDSLLLKLKAQEWLDQLDLPEIVPGKFFN